MIKQSIEGVARTRWAAPILIALTVVAVMVNEGVYRSIAGAQAQSSVLIDARLAATRTLHLLAEAEAAARAHLAAGSAGDRRRYESAVLALKPAQDAALALLIKIDPVEQPAVERLRSLIDAHVQRLAAWMEGRAPHGGQPGASAQGRAEIAQLDREFDNLLADADAAYARARASVSDMWIFNRLAIDGLLLLSLVALLLFARQLRRNELERAQAQERLERQIRERTGELRDLAGYLVSAREDERARLARELHDEMGGLFTAMKLELARLRRVAGLPPSALERLTGTESRLNEGIALKRRIIENLRPSTLDQLGLTAAIERLCADTAAVSGVAVHTELQDVDLDSDAELTVFRVVQEALTNVCKYASAREVWVRLTRGERAAQVQVQDDGKGFDADRVSAGRHGIVGMRVRLEALGGRLQVSSSPGRGTRIVAELPLSPELRSAA